MKRKNVLADRRLILGALALIIILVVAFAGINTTSLFSLSGGSKECTVRQEIDTNVINFQEAEEEWVVPKDLLTERPEVCDENGCIDTSVFAKLPQYPKDLEQLYLLIKVGKIKSLENFTDNIPDSYYYRQPEFYSIWHDNPLNKQFYTNPNQGYLSIWGAGAYPGDQFITVKGGGYFDIISYWHAGFGVVKWQGMKLKEMFPSSGESGSTKVAQDTELAKKCIVAVTTPNILLLDPAFPVFLPNWAVKVKTRVYVDDNTPKGTYIVGLIKGSVPQEIEDQWVKQYKLGYTSGATSIGTGQPPLRIFLTVE